jgi:hypothetical protein
MASTTPTPTDPDLDPVDGPDAPPADERPNHGWLGWLISGTVHASVLAIFAFAVWQTVAVEQETPPVRIATLPPPPPEVEKPKEQRTLDKPTDTVLTTVDSPVADVPNPITSLDLPVDVSTSEDESDSPDPKGREEAVANSEMGGMGAFMAIGAGGGSAGMYGKRSGGGRKRAVGQYGGSRGSESAVEAGLRWLRRHQSPDGSWDPVTYPVNCQENPKCEPGENMGGAREALTGYALLCFLGAGYDHRVQNPYRATVRRGLDALLAMQKPNGVIGSRNYEHPVAAMALFEAYGMTQDPDLREPSERALKIILERQAVDPQARDRAYARLGWDYVAGKADRNDSSVTGWNVMALKSAVGAGLAEAQPGLDGAKIWLERAWKATNDGREGRPPMPTDPYGESTFPYTWNALTGAVKVSVGSNKSHDLACVGMVCAVFLGRDAGDLMLETLANHAMKHQKPTSWDTYNSYYTYYNTLGMFQVGGEKWKIWNGAVRDFIVNAQRKGDGCFDGSWDWDKGVKWHGSEVGRVLSTCYAILNLEVYYRYDQVAGPRRR